MKHPEVRRLPPLSHTHVLTARQVLGSLYLILDLVFLRFFLFSRLKITQAYFLMYGGLDRGNCHGPGTESVFKSSMFRLWLPRGRVREGMVRECGTDMDRRLCLKWRTTRTHCSTRNAAQGFVAAWMGGETGGEWVPVYVCPSPFALHLKLSQRH